MFSCATILRTCARAGFTLTFLVSAASAQNTDPWCPPAIQQWSVSFSLTGNGTLVEAGNLVQSGPTVVPGIAHTQIMGKITFVPVSGGSCLWTTAPFGRPSL
jgi:hypothetical protein